MCILVLGKGFVCVAIYSRIFDTCWTVNSWQAFLYLNGLVEYLLTVSCGVLWRIWCPNHGHRKTSCWRLEKRHLRNLPVDEEESDSSSDDEYLYSTGTNKSKIPTVVVKINNVDIKMIIDTGASIDIVDETAFKHINQDNITLQPSSKRLLAYGSKTQLMSRGQFQGTISFQNQQCNQHSATCTERKSRITP